MNNELIIFQTNEEKYIPIVKEIGDYLPIIEKDTKNFYKTQSFFMDNLMTVSHPTPLRNIRQCLAEIQKSKLALQESYYKLEKNKIEIEKLKRKLAKETDELEIKLIQVEIEEKQVNIYNTEEYQKGALRKVHNHINQIKAIKEANNIQDFTEEDFEAEEEKYHIMKAFEQAICSARPRMGVVDEGNQIYFSQIGVNGALAQTFIAKLFSQEQEIILQGKYPSPTMTLDFLEEMAKVFKGCSKFMLQRKGMVGV